MFNITIVRSRRALLALVAISSLATATVPAQSAAAIAAPAVGRNLVMTAPSARSSAVSAIPMLAAAVSMSRAELTAARAEQAAVVAAVEQWKQRQAELQALDESADGVAAAAGTLASALTWAQNASSPAAVENAGVDIVTASQAAAAVLTEFGVDVDLSTVDALVSTLDAHQRHMVPVLRARRVEHAQLRALTSHVTAMRAWAAAGREQLGDQPSLDDANLGMFYASLTARAALDGLAAAVAGPLGADAVALADVWDRTGDTRLAVVMSGLMQLGKPYVFATNGPDAFDCSGFTSFAWRTAGVSLPGYSYAQNDMLGDVPAEQMVPGDLVFWDRSKVPGWSGPPGHVAMYLGSENLIVEANGGARAVRVSRYGTSYLSGFGRIPLSGE
jgi:peptidoglycan DL-endopeptidase CwlO